MPVYLSINGVKKTKYLYAGIPNIGVKKITKGFQGDANGVPKLFYKYSTKYTKTDNFYDKTELVRERFPVCGTSTVGLSADVRDGEWKYFDYKFSKNIPLNAQNINVSVVISGTFGAEVGIIFRRQANGFDICDNYEFTDKYVTISHNIGNNSNDYVGFGFVFLGHQSNAKADVRSITIEYELEN